MKKFISLIVCTCGLLIVNAQVVIGPNSESVVPNEKVILSFTTEGMGIVLPIIDNAPSERRARIKGAIFTSSIDRQVKVWIDGTEMFDATFVNLTTPLSSSILLPSGNTSSLIGGGITIGDNKDMGFAKGILELRDNTKALILPNLGASGLPPNKYIKSPYIGTIGFYETTSRFFGDSVPSKGMLWVYGGGPDGEGLWHLWSAGPSGWSVIVDDDYISTLP